MNYVPRASILHRPAKAEAGKANVEHADVEWAKEQGRLRAKAERAAATEQRLVGAFYATPEERRQAWAPAQLEAEQLAAARAAAAEQERAREAAWLAQPRQVVLDTQRPWNAASSTYYMSPEVEEAARRRGQREASDANRLISQRRAAHDAQQHAAEQDALRRDYQAEETWFNRGAANDRWIAPEHRVKHRSAAQSAPAPPPYFCDAEGGSSAGRPSSFAAAGAARPATASRRAQEGQGVAAALRHDAAPASSGGSFSGGYGTPGSVGGGAAAQARPRTAPAQQQRQYPWSWGA